MEILLPFIIYISPPHRHLGILPSHQVSTGKGLRHGYQIRKLLISHLLKDTKQTSFEEHLRHRYNTKLK